MHVLCADAYAAAPAVAAACCCSTEMVVHHIITMWMMVSVLIRSDTCTAGRTSGGSKRCGQHSCGQCVVTLTTGVAAKQPCPATAMHCMSTVDRHVQGSKHISAATASHNHAHAYHPSISVHAFVFMPTCYRVRIIHMKRIMYNLLQRSCPFSCSSTATSTASGATA